MSSNDPLEDIEFRIRHTMLPVRDVERTIDFYTRLLGMDVMRLRDDPERNMRTVYLGYGSEDTGPALELVETGGPDEHRRIPPWAGHVAVFVSNLHKLWDTFEREGVNLASEPRPVRPGSRDLVAWIRDPDGYGIELTEKHSATGPPRKKSRV